MLHGAYADHHHMMHDFEPCFVDRPGWQRIYIDLPGMGSTPARSWIHNQDDMLDVLLSFLTEVVPSRQLVLAGVSYGGYLARGLVHQLGSRIDGVCLIVPMVYGFDRELDVPPAVTLVRNDELGSELAPDETDMYDALVVQDRTVLELIRSQIAPAARRADGQFVQNLLNGANASFSFNPDSDRPPLSGPSLFVLGRQDSTVGYRDAWTVLENYPRASFAVLDRAGHLAAYDQPVLVRALVNEWLDRLQGHRASGSADW
jgi:pimeloyl-ACP methyl ester carboxylesterase